MADFTPETSETVVRIRGRRAHEPHEKNPFIASITVKSRYKCINRRNDMALISTETGEVQEDTIAGFAQWKEVETDKFVKLYVNGVKALTELTSAGAKVFEVLYLKMQDLKGQDQIHMSFAAVNQDKTPMSLTTYTRGMRELIDKQFLAASVLPTMFWVNPSFLWNGDRLVFMQEYYRKGSLASMRNQQRIREEELRSRQRSLPFTDTNDIEKAPEEPPEA